MPAGRSCSSPGNASRTGSPRRPPRTGVYPFGEVRDLPNDGLAKISATDFGYTGQRALDAQGNSFPGLHRRQSSAGSLGLMDYKARFYDAYITHFSQPDSIIPDPSNPQSLNRYSYSINNPINYNDPSGHRPCENDHCDQVKLEYQMFDDYGWTLNGSDWSGKDITTVYQAGSDISSKVGGKDNVAKLFSDVEFGKKAMDNGGLTTDAHHIWLNTVSSKWTTWSVAHELGHAWDYSSGMQNSAELEDFTGGHTNFVQGILFRIGITRCANDQASGCNNAGYYYGDVPPKGSDRNFNRLEDFAETFAASIYPEAALAAVQSMTSYNPSSYNIWNYSDYTTTSRGMWIDVLVYLSTH